MPTVSRNNVGRGGRGCAFQDSVIGGIGGIGFELADDRNHAEKCEQIRDGFDDLLGGECQLRLRLFGQLAEDFAAGHAFNPAGPSQFEALEWFAFPADT
jgi:hypothetical protein